MKQYLAYTVILVLAGLAGFYLERNLAQQKIDQENQHLAASTIAPASLLGKTAPEFAMEDLEGHKKNIKDWHGKVVLLNFWATWCPPCKKEIPGFLELYQQYHPKGFDIVGIAIDNEQDVRDFVDTMGMNYTIIASNIEGTDLAVRYGNNIGALPYSVFIGRDGKIAYARPGGLSKQQTEKIIQSLL